MMGLRYQTRDGDTIDYIAWKHYGGTAPGVVEQLLEANPGLVRYGMVLPAGLDIALPDMPPRVAPGEALWG